MRSRLEAIKEGAWSKIDSGIAFVGRHARGTVLGVSVTVAAASGGVVLYEGAQVLNGYNAINHAKPEEVEPLKQKQQGDFGMLYGSTVVALSGTYMALRMHLERQGYIYGSSPLWPIFKIDPNHPDRGTLFDARSVSQDSTQNPDSK